MHSSAQSTFICGSLRVQERRHARQLLPLQELQRRAAGGAHAREPARQAHLRGHRPSLTPFSSARLITRRACSTKSSSTSESPTPNPSALRNVFAMPPPISSLSIFERRFSRTSILVLTLAPPMTAAYGRFGSATARPR